jgi:hypothetical protein
MQDFDAWALRKHPYALKWAGPPSLCNHSIFWCECSQLFVKTPSFPVHHICLVLILPLCTHSPSTHLRSTLDLEQHFAIVQPYCALGYSHLAVSAYLVPSIHTAWRHQNLARAVPMGSKVTPLDAMLVLRELHLL